MKLIAPPLFALLLMTAFSYQESRANGKPKMNALFVSSKFSKSQLMRGNEMFKSETFYSIHGINNKILIINSSLEGRNQIENFKAKKESKKLKWLGLGAFWWAAFFDHYQDAIGDREGKKEFIFGAGTDQWHLA